MFGLARDRFAGLRRRLQLLVSGRIRVDILLQRLLPPDAVGRRVDCWSLSSSDQDSGQGAFVYRYLRRRHEIAILGFCALGALALIEFRLARDYLGAVAHPSLVLRGTSLPLEAIAVPLFLLVATIQLASNSFGEDVQTRLRSYVYCLAILSLALFLWIGIDALPVRRLPVQYWIAGVCAVFAFGASAVDQHASLSQSARCFLTDSWLFVRRQVVPLLAVVGVGLLLARPGATSQRPRPPMGPEFETWYAQQPRLPFPGRINGDKVLIVKFIDYQCPACRAAERYYEPLFRELLAAHPDRVEVITYDFPLNSACNRFISMAEHPAACESAVAVRLAKAQGKAAEMEAWLWLNQSRLSREAVFSAAKTVAGVSDIERRYEEELNNVRADVEVGHKLGIVATPTFFVDGVLLPFVPAVNLKAAVQHELTLIPSDPASKR